MKFDWRVCLGLGLMSFSVLGCGEEQAGAAKAEPKTSAQASAPEPVSSAAPADKQAKTDASASSDVPAASATTAAPGAVPATPGAAGQLPKGEKGILAPGVADKLLPVGGKPIVTVVEKGGEPREALAYDLAKDQKESFGIGMDMTMKMEMGGKATPAISMPRMNMLMDLAVKDKNAEKDVFIDGIMSGVSVDAGTDDMQKQLSESLKKELAGLKGLKMSYWVSPNGEVRDAKLDIPPNAPPTAQQMMQGMMQSMDSMVAPLPKEEVGVGAKWAALTRVSSNGADFLQMARYTLKQRDGEKLTIDIEIEQAAAKGSIDAPGLPPGVKTKLTSIDSAGKGSMLIDLKKITPVTSQMKMTMKMALNVEAQGKQENMAMEMGMAVEFTHPKK